MPNPEEAFERSRRLDCVTATLADLDARVEKGLKELIASRVWRTQV